MLERARHLLAGSLRYRLLVLALFPVLVVMPVVVGLAYLWSHEVSYRQLLMKVTTDLSVAHDAFQENQPRLLAELTLAAESYRFQSLIRALDKEPGAAEGLRQLLGDLHRKGTFDFVRLIDLDGCDLLDPPGCGLRTSLLMERARSGEAQVGVEIYRNEELERIDGALAQRVYLPLVSTPRAVPTDRVFEDRGMVIQAVYPLQGPDGEVFAYLSAGVLLNRNFDFVDRLRDLVYPPGSLVEGSIGTVTIFLDDVRISTNVPRSPGAQGERALGTRVSREVREQVLGAGRNWIDRAFVVNDWYISAYEPIADVSGRRVGMLYAGFLEAPFKAIYFQALGLLAVLFLAVLLLSIWLAVAGAKSIFRPVEAMARVIREVRAGHDRRIGPLDTHDELAELAAQFDQMLDQLSEQRHQIEAAAESLEHKVEERTAELQARTRELQENLQLLRRTREQLVAKEKLAAIGELTAGIAHEINNPTAVILGHMDLLLAELGDGAAPVRQDAELIIQQVYRIRAIINNLLQYSRPSDYLTELMDVDLNQVVQDSLVLVRHDLERKRIKVCLDLRARQTVRGNHTQFQQVVINLLINAANAMGEQGTLRIRTRDRGREGVLLAVRDNGCGIEPDVLPRIFDPFFSKTRGGTGLGLSVSYGILQRFGAEIDVRSRPGAGTLFLVWFLCNPPVDVEGDAWIASIS